MVRRYCISFAALLLSQPFAASAAQPYTPVIDYSTVLAQYDQQLPSSSSNNYGTDSGSYDEAGESSGESYFHLTLKITEEYTDNIYNLSDNKQSNFLTTVTPGFWMTVGQAQEIPEEIISRNTSAGGIVISPLRVDGYDWINGSLAGSVNFNHYSENSDSDNIGGNLSGRLQYKPGSKLSLWIEDRFSHKQVSYDAGNDTANNTRWDSSNILTTGFDWDLTEKFSTGVKYSNYILTYNDARDEYMERKDHTLSWYGAYNYSEKTSLFLEYRYIDLSFDSATYQDNEQNHIYGGINWASTEKTTLNFKAGYQQRKYINSNDFVGIADNSDETALALELGLNYRATEKTGLSFLLTNKLEESDSSVALGKTVFAGNFGYHQQLTQRLKGTLNLSYANEDYNQMVDPMREDDVYRVKPALQYTFRRWLMGELAYSYEKRESTDDFFEYDTNTVSLSLKSAW